SPMLMRFMSIDPLCERYYSISPYAYCANNPVRFVDPSGEYIESAWDIASLAMGVKSFVSNVKSGNALGAVVDGVGIVLDAAAVALPVIPGGAGAAIKGVRAIDKAVDVAKTADKAVDGISAMKRGVQNEAKVLESIGEIKNTTRQTATLPGTSEKVTVIPDAITDTKVIEIKDVKSLSNTKQIRGERQVAADAGKDFTIITGEKTHVSGNIPNGEIVRRKDIGPQ
ncbi:putative toxin, partial [Bacteroides sp.]